MSDTFNLIQRLRTTRGTDSTSESVLNTTLTDVVLTQQTLRLPPTNSPVETAFAVPASGISALFLSTQEGGEAVVRLTTAAGTALYRVDGILTIAVADTAPITAVTVRNASTTEALVVDATLAAAAG